MEAPDVGACFVPPDQVVDDEHLPWLQQERLVDQAVALHVFALVMDESLRDDVDDKVRIMRPELYVRALQIIQEPLALSYISACLDLSTDDVLRILQDQLLIADRFTLILQDSSMPQLGKIQFLPAVLLSVS